MVPRCLGATATRCLGGMASCYLSVMAPCCHGSSVPRCHGATVPWCHGALVPWCYAATGPRCLGSMVPRCLGATVPWFHGALVPWCRIATVPRCHGAMVPWCHGALVPRCVGALVSRCHGAWGPWCHGATVPSCPGALVQGFKASATVICKERRTGQIGVDEGPMPTARIPLVHTYSELAVQRAGRISSSPPTAYVFETGTPVPSPQSQSFSRSYGSILPTSLAYIVPSTRGCSPWRPDAVMSTIGRGRHSVLRIFKGRRERTGYHATCRALPAAGPYLQLSGFQGGQAVKQKRQLFPRLPPTSPDFLMLSSTTASWFRNFNPFPFRSTREMRCLSGFPRPLGSTNPCASAVHMEPFPSSAFKVLI
ncbi:hypothetical protein CQW23_33726 [Capsicum baccatum]|uniref:Protein TAR1 n=1 Tax=Capsicum baccatum TaxID=33114 RepID=A0A2G2V179_CAPBA|nr:hypothetical protein CQW23_33726 [Capsicum baccatum]